ncbi:MAG: class I SAM-dependent methyltransferase [Oligoflexia bacterium]|nr:class I SAM-dependent methyltransferase [Oligoflexia bacterium]
MSRLDVFSYNKEAWDAEVEVGNPWTVPVNAEAVQRARSGDLQILLTPTKPVPQSWLNTAPGAKVLCLASGGGQQGPLLAAAGADVTVLDASERQLAQDRLVAEREQLTLSTVLGTMTDLSLCADGSFDLIVHPVSNCFVEDVRPVWKEAYRVLKSGGYLLSGFNNPIIYSFDPDLAEKGTLQLKYPIPYSDVASLTEEERRRYTDKNWPLQFGHSLDDQIGGQIEAGFAIVGLYEDKYGNSPIDRFTSSFVATRARK